jgi:hypothetical protein
LHCAKSNSTVKPGIFRGYGVAEAIPAKTAAIIAITSDKHGAFTTSLITGFSKNKK